MAIADETNFEEKRLQDRIPLRILGTYLTDEMTATACEVRDIAPGGARLAASRLPASDGRIALNIPALGRFVGRVVWTAGDEFGVQFTGASHPRALAQQLTTRRSLEQLGIDSFESGETPELTMQRADGSTEPVRLKKLSVDGASFTAGRMPAAGETIEIDSMPGRVVKIVEDTFAVRFDPPKPDAG